MSIEIRLLGPIEVYLNGERVLIRGRVGRTVLARLAVSPEQPLTMNELAEALWGDDLPGNPNATIRSALSRLRSQLGRQAIERVNDSIVLRVDPSGIDFVQCERAAEQASCSAEPAEQLRLVDAALARWRGRALLDASDSVAFLSFLLHAEALRRELRRTRCEALVALDRSAEALVELRQLTLEDPFDVGAGLLLIEAVHDDAGAREALRVAGVIRSSLRTGGIAVPAELDELEHRLILQADEGPSGNRDAHARPQFRCVPRSIVGSPLLGRTREVMHIVEQLGRTSLVTLVGEPGIGKTRLAAAAAEVVVEPGSVAWVEANRAGWQQVLEDIGHELASREQADTITPCLVVIDACDAAGPQVTTELQRWAASLSTMPTVLCTSRSRLGVRGEWVIAIRGLSVRSASTDRLSAGAVLLLENCARMGFSVDHRVDPNRDTLEAVAAHLGGNPFVLALAARLVPSLGLGGLYRRLSDDLAVLCGAIGDSELEQIDSVAAWLDELGHDARSLIDEAANLPQPFHAHDVSRVGAMDSGTMLAALAELSERSLVVREPDSEERTVTPIARLYLAGCSRPQPERGTTRRRYKAGDIVGAIAALADEGAIGAAQRMVEKNRHYIAADGWILREEGRWRELEYCARVLAPLLFVRPCAEIDRVLVHDQPVGVDGAIASAWQSVGRGDYAGAWLHAHQAMDGAEGPLRSVAAAPAAYAALCLGRLEDAVQSASTVLSVDDGRGPLWVDLAVAVSLVAMSLQQAPTAALEWLEESGNVDRSRGSLALTARAALALGLGETIEYGAINTAVQACQSERSVRGSVSVNLIDSVVSLRSHQFDRAFDRLGCALDQSGPTLYPETGACLGVAVSALRAAHHVGRSRAIEHWVRSDHRVVRPAGLADPALSVVSDDLDVHGPSMGVDAVWSASQRLLGDLQAQASSGGLPGRLSPS